MSIYLWRPTPVTQKGHDCFSLEWKGLFVPVTDCSIHPSTRVVCFGFNASIESIGKALVYSGGLLFSTMVIIGGIVCRIEIAIHKRVRNKTFQRGFTVVCFITIFISGFWWSYYFFSSIYYKEMALTTFYVIQRLVVISSLLYLLATPWHLVVEQEPNLNLNQDDDAVMRNKEEDKTYYETTNELLIVHSVGFFPVSLCILICVILAYYFS